MLLTFHLLYSSEQYDMDTLMQLPSWIFWEWTCPACFTCQQVTTADLLNTLVLYSPLLWYTKESRNKLLRAFNFTKLELQNTSNWGSEVGRRDIRPYVRILDSSTAICANAADNCSSISKKHVYQIQICCSKKSRLNTSTPEIVTKSLMLWSNHQSIQTNGQIRVNKYNLNILADVITTITWM